MPISYRIYTIGRGGHFLGRPEVVECADDKEAVEKAMQVVNCFDAEVWEPKALCRAAPRQPTKDVGPRQPALAASILQVITVRS
jgi:hypothetical protein